MERLVLVKGIIVLRIGASIRMVLTARTIYSAIKFRAAVMCMNDTQQHVLPIATASLYTVKPQEDSLGAK